MFPFAKIPAFIQSSYHLISGTILLLCTKQLFEIPAFYTFIREDPNQFTPTKSDIEFLSILGGMFAFIGFIFLICLFGNKRKAMLIISIFQITLHTQIKNILKPFKGVNYILSFTTMEFIFGIITSVLVIIDFTVNYPKEKEEERKQFNEKVQKLKKEYGIKDEENKKTDDSKDNKKSKKNN